MVVCFIVVYICVEYLLWLYFCKNITDAFEITQCCVLYVRP